MPQFNDLHKLFIHELKDVCSAEKQLTQALPKMAKAAESSELREAFENHLDETKKHYEKIVKLLESFDSTQGREKCVGMAGIIEEGEKLIKKHPDPIVLDAGLIASAQKAEHYEIASYGTLRAWAELMGHTKAVSVFDSILEQELAADETLTEVSETVNSQATAQAH